MTLTYFISAPRTISYSIQTTKRNFEFQNPKVNRSGDLEGNLVKKLTVPESKDEAKYKYKL